VGLFSVCAECCAFIGCSSLNRCGCVLRFFISDTLSVTLQGKRRKRLPQPVPGLVVRQTAAGVEIANYL
jgi:hypothetical protein